MKIDEEKFRKFCISNKVKECNEDILRKLCYEVASGFMILTTLEEDQEVVSKISGTKNKVKYLRNKGYTQERAAEVIGISTRHVQRIEKKFKNNT